MADDKTTSLADVNRTLEAILVLMIEHSADGSMPTMREQIAKLYRLGYEPVEIAKVLRKDRVAVNVELFRLRKLQKKTRKSSATRKGSK